MKAALRHSVFFIISLVIGVLSASCTCTEPYSQEDYVKTRKRDKSGRYEFVLDMPDSLKRYDLDLIVVMDCGKKRFSSFENASVNMLWVSPSGQLFNETVWLSRKDLSSRTLFSRLFEVRYRAGLVPTEYGNWKLYIALKEDVLSTYSIPGIGIRLKKKN